MLQNVGGFGLNTIKMQQKEASQKVKEDTIKQLMDLGINPDNVTSEADAQAKIQEAQSAQANAAVLTGNRANPMQQAFSDAKKLADKLGVSISTGDNMDNILQKIDSKLKDLESDNAIKKEDKNITSDLRKEFANIHNAYSNAKESQSKVTGDMKTLAENNKWNSSIQTSNVTKQQVQSLEVAQNYKNDSIAKQEKLSDKNISFRDDSKSDFYNNVENLANRVGISHEKIDEKNLKKVLDNIAKEIKNLEKASDNNSSEIMKLKHDYEKTYNDYLNPEK